MSPFGVVSRQAQGHVVTTILIGMVAMLFTAISLRPDGGRLPERGLGLRLRGAHELHPALGYVTGWSMLFDYVMNPIICVIWCSKAAANFLPQCPSRCGPTFFALLFTFLNLQRRSRRAPARTRSSPAGWGS